MDYIQWIRSGLKTPGKSQAGLARHLGIDRSQITKMLSDERDLKVKEIKKIAEYLELPEPSGLGALKKTTSPEGIKYMGTVGSRYWYEPGQDMQDNGAAIPPLVDPRYPIEVQSYIKVEINSHDNELRAGDCLIAVPFQRYRGSPVSGDLIICKNKKNGLEQLVLRRAKRAPEGVTLAAVLNDDSSADSANTEDPHLLIVALHRPLQ